jgi:hypothetical protein
MRSLRGYAVAAAVVVVGVGMSQAVTTAAHADPAPGALGSSTNPAGSCWEIAQSLGSGATSAANGDYWLLTPQMSEPQQFYCDIGNGGWVLIGKGRDGWSEEYDGTGSAADLLTPDLATMSAKTTQYPSRTVDALMGGTGESALPGGIRLRRATNTAGTTWQEVRLTFTKGDRWSWTFGAEHPLGSWSFDGSNGSGGTSANFGSDSQFKRVVATAQQSQSYHLGFAYGSRVAGSSSATSYLWSAANNGGGAIPYTQMYIEPHVMSTGGFSTIPDSGTPASTLPATFNSRALDSPWGVSGIAGNTSTEGDVEVQAFTEYNGVMYVGGNFATVQQDAAGTGRTAQPFLAAFDEASGNFIPSFHPVLNEQVHALATLPNGTIVAGGEFTQANGAAAGGLVGLDPTTGATVSGWKASASNASGTAKVLGLDVQGNWLYVGGALSKLTGGPKSTGRAVGDLGRVSVTDGTPDTWNPKLNGSVNDVDASADGSKVYAVGYFGKAGTVAALRAVSLDATTAAVSPQFNPTWSNSANNYQRAVQAVGNRVYVGGSEHSLFGFDTATMNRVSGSIAKQHGDIQVIADGGKGIIYAGCHCDNYTYQDAYTWPTLSSGWTEADSIGWFGGWDAATGKRVPDFVPTMKMRLGSGIWALKVDSLGNMWAGGDIATVTTKSKAGKWSGGFARFDPSDATAPGVPANLHETSSDGTNVSLAWNKATDTGGSGGVRYEILRDDRPIASTTGNTTSITVPMGGNNRFFVRAIDKAGNVSASTPVLNVT